jgi:hypothetical protein
VASLNRRIGATARWVSGGTIKIMNPIVPKTHARMIFRSLLIGENASACVCSTKRIHCAICVFGRIAPTATWYPCSFLVDRSLIESLVSAHGFDMSFHASGYLDRGKLFMLKLPPCLLL